MLHHLNTVKGAGPALRDLEHDLHGSFPGSTFEKPEGLETTFDHDFGFERTLDIAIREPEGGWGETLWEIHERIRAVIDKHGPWPRMTDWNPA